MAPNNEPLETNDEALQSPSAGELDDDTEQISLEDATKISGGGAPTATAAAAACKRSEPRQ